MSGADRSLDGSAKFNLGDCAYSTALAKQDQTDAVMSQLKSAISFYREALEANPADKDPVPPPFDNTYNSPEHDAFVLKVKYQRNDDFFTSLMTSSGDIESSTFLIAS